MRGKEKCKALKEIRRQIAEKNDIPYVVSQCAHQGDCRGTCPKCEAELRYLERELAVRQGMGRAVAVVGISASVCAGLTACSPVEPVRDAPGISVEEPAGGLATSQLQGDIPVAESENPDTAAPEGDGEVRGTEEPTAESSSPAAEESRETREIDDNAAGAIPLPEEPDEILTGEILPYEELSEESDLLEGDIALEEMAP